MNMLGNLAFRVSLGAYVLVVGCGGVPLKSGDVSRETTPTPAITSVTPKSALAGSGPINLTVNGTGFIFTSVVQVDGNDETTTYVSDTQLTAVIPASIIASAGQVSVVVLNGSVSSGSGTPISFEVDNPAPGITSLNPTSLIIGTTSFNVTVIGSGFVSSTAILVNGNPRASQVSSSTQAQVTLIAADVAATGALSIVAVNPAPGGGSSASTSLDVVNPPPGLSSISPGVLAVGTSSLDVRVMGTGFLSSTAIQVNGSPRVTAYASSTQLTATLTGADVITPASLSIRAVNPSPGGGTSAAITLAVDAPPVLTEAVPIRPILRNSSPPFAFTTTKAGTIAYGGNCSSTSTAAMAGTNVIRLGALAPGTYSNCTVTVTDSAGISSLPLAVSTFTVSNSSYPPYTPSPELVQVAPYDTPIAGVPNVESGPGGADYFFQLGQPYRIRQNGTIQQIKLFLGSKVSDFRLDVWRADGSNFDLVGESDNVAADMSPGEINTLTLQSPISAKEGDYYGYKFVTAPSTSHALYARTAIAGVTMYYAAAPTLSAFDWSAQPSFNGEAVPIEIDMTAPQVVFIGDSIVAGHPGNFSFLEATASTNLASTMEDQFSALTGYTFQNMGVSSQTTHDIAARFARDALGAHPQIIVLEGGVNDIADGVSEGTFLDNWTAMLNSAQNQNVMVLALKILPWTNGSNEQMKEVDKWNTDLQSLVSHYPNAILVDGSPYVGQYRAGGTKGNLWNIDPAYAASDGVHFNKAGYGQIAQALTDAIPD